MLEKAIEVGHRISKINVDEDADFSSQYGHYGAIHHALEMIQL